VAVARRVVDFAFAHMGLRRLVAHAALPNGRGSGALRKLGACCTGLRRQTFERHGVRLDQAIWVILRDNWWAALTARWSHTVH
jgi:RimJ/RimL family protein N-acetyltransferase